MFNPFEIEINYDRDDNGGEGYSVGDTIKIFETIDPPQDVKQIFVAAIPKKNENRRIGYFWIYEAKRTGSDQWEVSYTSMKAADPLGVEGINYFVHDEVSGQKEGHRVIGWFV
jgi:hypothetical protein